MKTTIQDMKCIGSSGGVTVYQEPCGIVDTTGIKSCRVTALVTEASNATLSLETASSLDGPWDSQEDISADGTTEVHFIQSNVTTDNQLRRYLRWSVAFSAAGKCSFGLTMETE
jgi:hypothetical protein